MGNIAAWLGLLVVPYAKKILLALGIGILTYEGFTAVANQARDAVVASYGALSADVLNILALGGINQSIGIVLAAMVARAGILAVGKLGRVVA